MNILCVDDDPWIGALYQQILDKLAADLRPHAPVTDYHVFSVTNGRAAWDLLASNLDKFDMVVIDQVMPGMTGLELISLLRGRSYRGRIIMQSAFITSEITKSLKTMAVEEVVHKPVSVATILNLFEAVA